MTEQEEEPLLNTGVENSYSLRSVRDRFDSANSFIHGQDHINIRSTTASNSDTDLWLKFNCDIDGITVEWERLAGTTHNFHHIKLAPRDHLSMKKVYPMLKKHDNLTVRNDISLKMLQSSVGVQLFYDAGWEYYLSLIPVNDCNIQYGPNVIRDITLTWIKQLRHNVRVALNRCLLTGHLTSTIDKNNINEAKTLFIMPSDSESVLCLFDSCVAETVTPQGLRKCLFSFRFGEKNPNVVNLPIRHQNAVSRICVHSAIVIELADTEEDGGLFWSRNAIRSLIGNRGVLTSAMSFTECANFQSNLDGRSLDIGRDLRNACAFPERVHFVQLYADLPHKYPTSRHHPVSASILIGRGLRAHSKQLDDDAKAYLSELDSNFRKLRHSKCRLEYVFSLPQITDTLDPTALISTDSVKVLIKRYPLIVPFIGNDLIHILREVGNFCTAEMQRLLNTYRGSGHSEAVWNAYQLEIAAEKLLWGRPFSWRSNQYAINLGIGLGYPTRSLTDARGFLCFADKFSCCEDEHSCPPLAIYTNSQTLRIQIGKMFAFEDYLDSSDEVLGRRIIMIMMQDFHHIGVKHETFATFFATLRQTNVAMTVRGTATSTQIHDILCTNPKWKPPCISHLLITVLAKAGKNVQRVIKEGILQTAIRYFPAVRQRDDHGHGYLNWKSSDGVWLIKDTGIVDDGCEQTATLMCPLIVTELESRKLCFTSKLNSAIHAFPWVLPAIRKIRCRRLNQQDMITTLTFVTCVAYLQGGRYVDYNRLSKLEIDMPLKQVQLRELEVLGKFLLPKVNRLPIYRLHHSITGLNASKQTATTTADINKSDVNRQATHDHANEMQLLDDGDAHLPRINNETEHLTETDNCLLLPQNNEQHHIPNGVYRKWSTHELAIIGFVAETAVETSTNIMELYTRYITECRTAGIPDRGMAAFKRKIIRIRQSHSQ